MIQNKLSVPQRYGSSDTLVSSSSKQLITGERSKQRMVGVPIIIMMLWLLRILVLDLPLFLIFAASIGLDVLEQVHQEYLEPLRHAMHWNEDRADTEVTSYHYYCTPEDITATSADELIIPPHWSTSQSLVHMQHHGATIWPDILSNTTAEHVRSFILTENQRLKDHPDDGFWVIANDHRYSFGIRVDQHPSIAVALQEIATHSKLKPMLEQLVGRNPAIIEFTAITSTYGAEIQRIHQDVVPEGSAAKYARSFMPSYSLFIPLQDVTKEMGATDICPGTQMCGDGGSAETICDKYSFPASGNNNKWPKGWGALVNQQTTHRGTAFTDPKGLDRVVFILTFAPRPQYNSVSKVESRMIGQSGSYSLHWQQWGHTLEDFANVPRAMAQPWRTLRSLGLYKPRSAKDWGWDVVTVALMRMANGDTGYTRDTLEAFVEKGGFAYLPPWLQGDIGSESDDDGDFGIDGGWHDFLVATVHKVKEALTLTHQVFLGVVVGTLLLVSMGTGIVRKNLGSGVSVFLRNIVRLLLLHGIVLALAWYYQRCLSQTPWARHIKNGKLFQPFADRELHKLPVPPTEAAGSFPYTLPTRHDVLLAPNYQSRYLASYTNALDYGQPGNKKWKELVGNYSWGFEGLSISLQEHLCDYLVFETMLCANKGRMLKQVEAGRWSELDGQDALDTCRRDILRQKHPLTKKLMQELDYLKSETKFGAWRHTAMQKSAVPSYLAMWTDRILGVQSPTKDMTKHITKGLSVVSQGIRKPVSIKTTMAKVQSKTKSKIPPLPVLCTPPYTSAWLATGDIVEGLYQGSHHGKPPSRVEAKCMKTDCFGGGLLPLSLCMFLINLSIRILPGSPPRCQPQLGLV
jgi:hypothetical protein